MAAKKILMLVGDFGEDYEIMVPYQTLLAVGHQVHAGYDALVVPGGRRNICASIASCWKWSSTSPAPCRWTFFICTALLLSGDAGPPHGSAEAGPAFDVVDCLLKRGESTTTSIETVSLRRRAEPYIVGVDFDIVLQLRKVFVVAAAEANEAIHDTDVAFDSVVVKKGSSCDYIFVIWDRGHTQTLVWQNTWLR